MACRGRFGHVDKPLVRSHGFDDFPGTLASRYDHRMRLFGHEELSRSEIGQHRLARRIALQAAIFLRRVVVDGRVERENGKWRQGVALYDLPVVEIVRTTDV